MLAAALLGLSVGTALAQGTPEQREACTPDALKLCQDTIPDIGRTEACMRRHEAELSPRCHAVFNTPSAGSETRRAARAAESDEHEAPARPRRLQPREPDEREAGGPPYDETGPEPRRLGPPDAGARTADGGPPDGADEPWSGPRGYGPPGYGPPGPYGGRFADGGPADGYDVREPHGYGPPDRDDGRFADRGPPDERGPADARRYHYGPPGDADVPAARGGRRARIAIRRLCAQDLIDPRTCALVRRALAEER